MSYKPYDIIDDTYIKLTEGPYAGVEYSYGKVQLVEGEDALQIKFEYNLHGNTRVVEKFDEFEQYIGSILHKLIEERLAAHKVVYSGGTE